MNGGWRTEIAPTIQVFSLYTKRVIITANNASVDCICELSIHNILAWLRKLIPRGSSRARSACIPI
jgi:hypothetical protein